MSSRDLFRWTGIPYSAGGHTRSGADCYGLARLCAFEEFGVTLPLRPVAEIPEDAVAGSGLFQGWRAVSRFERRAADLAVFPAGDALHCALLMDQRRILNTALFSVSHIADLTAEPYRSSLQGVYRWVSR